MSTLSRDQLAVLGLLSGDEDVGKASSAILKQQGRRGARVIHLGNGFLFDPNTGETTQDPGYAQWVKDRDDRYLQRPSVRPYDTAGGVTPVDINPQSPSFGPGQEIPLERPPSPGAAQEAAQWERAAADTARLLQNPAIERIGAGFGGRMKQIGVDIASSFGPTARSIALDAAYDEEEQGAIRDMSRIFAATIKEFAGAAQTESEKANILEFLPTDKDGPEQRIDKILGFVEYAQSRAGGLRNPNQRMEVPNVSAQGRSQEPQAQGGLSPEEQAELQRLRKKYGRSN